MSAEQLDNLIVATEAATKIQSTWRGSFVRRTHDFRDHQKRLDAMARRNPDHDLATELVEQSMGPPPGSHVNAEDPLVQESAVRIQSTYRMHVAKKKTSAMREDARKQESAVRIQKVFRGGKTRAELKRRESQAHIESKERTRRQLIERYKEELDNKDQLMNVNASLQRRLAEYFHAKRADDRKEDDAPGANAALSGDLEARYMRYLGQFKELHAEHARLQEEYNELSTDMQSRLEDRKAKCKEFRDSFLQFRREVCAAAENSRTGKPLSESIVRQYEETIEAKDVEVSRARLKNIAYRNRLHAIEDSLKQKEELAEGLHLIDFEQLKIENQTLNEKIEERNEELSKLQRKTTTTVHILTHVKEKLQFVQQDNQRLRRELTELDEHLAASRDAVTKAKHARDAVKGTNSKLRDAMPLVGNDDLLIDYEVRKERVQALKKEIEELRARQAAVKERALQSTQTLQQARDQQHRTLQARQALTGVPFVK
jgi:hypothetical protein